MSPNSKRFVQMTEVPDDEGFATVREVAEAVAAIAKSVHDFVQPIFDRLAAVEKREHMELAPLEGRIKHVEEAASNDIKTLDGKIRRLFSLMEGVKRRPGPKGDRGDQGPPGPKGEQGAPGAPGQDGSPDTPLEIRDKLETLRGDKRLHISAIAGTEQLTGNIELKPRSFLGLPVPSRGFFLYVNGTKQGLVSSLNLIAGTGMTVSYTRGNGRNDVTLSSTGNGGSLAVLTTASAINDTNTSFTFSGTPLVVIVNGNAFRHGHGCSISGTSVTLDEPVGSPGDIYGLG